MITLTTLTLNFNELKKMVENGDNDLMIISKKKYNELLEKIKELEYWQEIERRRADLDAGNGKVMTLEQVIKTMQKKKAKSEGIELQ